MGCFMGKAWKWDTIRKNVATYHPSFQGKMGKLVQLGIHISRNYGEKVENGFGESLAVSAPFVVLSFFIPCGPETLF